MPTEPTNLLSGWASRRPVPGWAAAGFTGLDTSVGGGSNICGEMKNLNTEAGQVADRIYLTLVYNVIAVLEERGVTVLD